MPITTLTPKGFVFFHQYSALTLIGERYELRFSYITIEHHIYQVSLQK